MNIIKINHKKNRNKNIAKRYAKNSNFFLFLNILDDIIIYIKISYLKNRGNFLL